MAQIELYQPSQILSLHSAAWDILIVDDDDQVHTVTTLALSNIQVEGKNLTFYHAYSSSQAIQILKENKHIAVMLLDVVMEEDNSGLELVKIIRDELQNHTVRIILRTGQPGSAPELDVIQQYDINDYKMKSELTRTRLISSLTTAIRSYLQITQLAFQSLSLKIALEFNNTILLADSLSEFLEPFGIFLPQLFPQLVQIEVFQELSRNSLFTWKSDSFQRLTTEMTTNYHDAPQVHGNFSIDNHIATIPLISSIWSEAPTKERTLIKVENQKPYTDVQKQLLALLALQLSTAFQNLTLVKKLEFSAYKDSLTGLLNKVGFLEEVENQVSSNPDTDLYTMVIMDIDEFSKINTSMGHEIGDLLLTQFADRLRQHFSHQVTLGRIASDIFALYGPSKLLIPHLVLHAIEEPFRLELEIFPLRATMGFQENLENQTPIELLNNASIAMKKAKGVTPGRFLFFTTEMKDAVNQSLNITRQLKPALINNEFSLYYQPQVDLTTHKVIGCEALLRWIKPDGTLIPPSDFIGIAEQSGIIHELGKWVLSEAVTRRCAWTHQDLVPDSFFIGINASVQQFLSSSFITYISHLMTNTIIQPGQIDIEITESIIMQDTQKVIELIYQLKEFGITISIDDFGTGYSSLSYLLKLPIDRLKIDRSFIQTIHTDMKSSNLTSLVINLGKELGITVLAEGVELPDQAQHVQDLGCDFAQGYLYGKPMPEPEFLSWLHSWPNKEN